MLHIRMQPDKIYIEDINEVDEMNLCLKIERRAGI